MIFVALLLVPKSSMVSFAADAAHYPNQPIRMNGQTLARELGQSKFSEAKAAWNAIK